MGGAGPPVALVTGATSGIGTAVARRLVRDGFAVLLTGRSARRGLPLAGELGARAAFVAADLLEDAAPTQVVAAALESFGRVDALVNNAAVDHTRALLETPLGEVRAVLETNVVAAIAMLQAAARAMEGGGAIVNVTSRLASVGVPTMATYAASKGALLALTRAAAVELAPRGIRVNAVAPGMTRTPLYDDWVARQPDPAAAARAAVGGVPQGRLALPEEVAGAIAYLISPDAEHVTGASLAVDGGYTAA